MDSHEGIASGNMGEKGGPPLTPSMDEDMREAPEQAATPKSRGARSGRRKRREWRPADMHPRWGRGSPREGPPDPANSYPPAPRLLNRDGTTTEIKERAPHVPPPLTPPNYGRRAQEKRPAPYHTHRRSNPPRHQRHRTKSPLMQQPRQPQHPRLLRKGGRKLRKVREKGR